MKAYSTNDASERRSRALPASIRYVDRPPMGVLRRLHDPLGKRGVSVLGEGDVLERSTHLNS